MKKIKNLKVNINKIKAILLSGTMIFSVTACGPTKEETASNSEEIVTTMEEETKVTTTQAPTTTESKNNKITIQTTTTKPMTTTTTTTQVTTTQAPTTTKKPTTTQAPTTSESYTPEYIEPTEESTEEYIPDYIEYPEETQPIEPTTPQYVSRTGHTLNEITSPDAEVAYYAILEYGNKLRNELFGDYVLQNQYGMCTPALEAGTIFVTLNYNQGINNEALADIYEYDSKEKFRQYSDTLNLAYYQYLYNTNVDFTQYVLDQDLANFLNRVSQEFKDYMNGNQDALINEMNNYFSNPIDNYIKYYFMRNTQNPTDYYADEVVEAQQMYFNNVVDPIYDQISSYKSYIK